MRTNELFELLTGSITYAFSPLFVLMASTFVSLLLGLVVSWVYRYKSKYSQSMAVTLVLLPALVQIIIMLASGNIGVGIAVAGAFSLIRFRSMAGTAREIGHLFFAMSLGFVTGLGYLFFAVVYLFLIGSASILLTFFQYGKPIEDTRSLRIKIPENLDYDGLFDDIFEKYTLSASMEMMQTTQMGSLYELKYLVRMKEGVSPKAFMDEIRVRNGNLTVQLSRSSQNRDFL